MANRCGIKDYKVAKTFNKWLLFFFFLPCSFSSVSLFGGDGTTAQPGRKKREYTHPSIPELSITRVLFPRERLYMHIYQLNMLIPAAIRPPGTSPGVFMTRNC